MRLEAVNGVIILKKDKSYLKDDPNLIRNNFKSENMNEIPEPYTGTIDSIGIEQDIFNIGQRIAFNDMGGIYIQMGDVEYVVITPDMVIGFLE